MKPVDFEYANGVAGKDQEGVKPLPLLRLPNAAISCWELSEEELQEVIKTRRIYVAEYIPENYLVVPLRVETHISNFLSIDDNG